MLLFLRPLKNLSRQVAWGVLLNTGHSTDAMNHIEDEYVPIRDAEDAQLGMFDKPLPCFGCGIGWFSWVLLPFFSLIALTHGCFFLLLPLAWICVPILFSWMRRFSEAFCLDLCSHWCGTSQQFSTLGSTITRIQGSDLALLRVQ